MNSLLNTSEHLLKMGFWLFIEEIVPLSLHSCLNLLHRLLCSGALYNIMILKYPGFIESGGYICAG